jgi:predicted porin
MSLVGLVAAVASFSPITAFAQGSMDAISLDDDPTIAPGATPPNLPPPASESVPEAAFEATDRTLPPLPIVAPTDEPLPEASATATTASDATVLERAEGIEQLELDPDQDDGWGTWGFTPLVDLLSTTDPGGRDNLTLGFDLDVGYDDNVFFSGVNRLGSLTSAVALRTVYTFGTPRFGLTTSLSAGTRYYLDRPGGNQDNNLDFSLALFYQQSPRLSFDFDARVQYLAQPSPQVVGGTFAFIGNYLVTTLNFEATYQLRPRFSIAAAYNLNALRYEEATVNAQSGFASQTFSLTANYLISPVTTLLLNYRYNPVDYYESGQGSDGNVLLLGVTRSVSPQFEWTLSGGAERRSIRETSPVVGAPTDAPTEYTGPFFEGEANYKIGEKSKIVGTLRYGTEPTGISAVAIQQTFRATLTLEQELGSRLSFTGQLTYQNDNVDQPGDIPNFAQTVYSASLSFTYKFNQTVSTFARYNYLKVETDETLTSYDRSFLATGITLSF